MRGDLDVIVIGGGVMGTASARSLAERGRSTLLLERSRIGHDRGSSGGSTRIFRLAYHHPEYVRLARRALDAWHDLESRAGETLLHTTGGVDAGEASEVCAEAMTAARVAFDRVDPDAIAERWPALRFDEHAPLIVQEDAGVCLVKETVAAQARLARDAGAEVAEETAVAAVRVSASGAELVTATERSFRAPVVVLAAGAWNAALLLQAGIQIGLRPTFEQPAYVRLNRPSPLPVLVDRSLDPDAPRYLVPDPRDARSVKVGTHLARIPIDPDALPTEPDRGRLAHDVAYAREHLRGAEPTGEFDTCIYTMAPDEDFVLDRRENVVVCSPCSGHGFKFAPLVGEIVADLVEGRAPTVPLDRFGSSRRSLSA